MATSYVTNFSGAFPFSDTTGQYALAAATALSYTVPGTAALNKYVVQFSYADDAEVWVNVNATATIPTAGTMHTDRRSELNPTYKMVKGGDVLSFISDSQVDNAGFILFSVTG